jgi:hypothetical protein
MYSYCYVYVFLLLCMLRSGYFVLLCCSVYCLCVHVYCTTATGRQANRIEQIQVYRHIISYVQQHEVHTKCCEKSADLFASYQVCLVGT